jgi:glycosyltransferase involved in cell wall biosynthesis
MHVGLDLLFLVPGRPEGRQTYARELARALREVRPDIELTVFLNRASAREDSAPWEELADTIEVAAISSAEHSAVWAMGETILLPRAARKAGVQVLHSPGNFGPLTGPFARVVTVHDARFLVRRRTRLLIPRAARRAHRVLTGSAASKHEVVAHLGVQPERVEVVAYGVAKPAGNPAEAANVRRRLNLGQRALCLSVAADLSHKNLPVLLDALATLEASDRPVLAFVGPGTDSGALLERARSVGVEDDVRLLGAVRELELSDLYEAAAMLLSPSRHEGFGLTILEAMTRGVPVACSDLPVHREVAGSAAQYFDPDDPAAIAAAIRLALSGGPEAEGMRSAGLQRAAAFSWPTTAEQTAAVYEEALELAKAGR